MDETRIPMTRYLGIDHGTKRIGLAVGDDTMRLASPIGAIDATAPRERVREQIIARAREYDVHALVIGLPLNMDGTEGPQARLVRTFGEALAAASAMPVHYQDERLSSFDAEQHLSGTGLTHGRKKAQADALAARAILQAFLEGDA